MTESAVSEASWAMFKDFAKILIFGVSSLISVDTLPTVCWFLKMLIFLAAAHAIIGSWSQVARIHQIRWSEQWEQNSPNLGGWDLLLAHLFIISYMPTSVQGSAKRWSPGCVNDAVKARQKWKARALTRFTKPGNQCSLPSFKCMTIITDPVRLLSSFDTSYRSVLLRPWLARGNGWSQIKNTGSDFHKIQSTFQHVVYKIIGYHWCLVWKSTQFAFNSKNTYSFTK